MELKPCPFCGKVGDVRHVKDDSYGGQSIFCARCDNAGVYGNKDKDDVVALWNHRPGEINAEEAAERVMTVLQEMQPVFGPEIIKEEYQYRSERIYHAIKGDE